MKGRGVWAAVQFVIAAQIPPEIVPLSDPSPIGILMRHKTPLKYLRFTVAHCTTFHARASYPSLLHCFPYRQRNHCFVSFLSLVTSFAWCPGS